MLKKLLAVFAASACTLSVSGAAYGQTSEEYGPEQVFYVYCFWGAGNGQVLVTQHEEVRWRDRIKILENGQKLIDETPGMYVAAVAYGFDKRLGLSENTQCEFEATPVYERRKPGRSFQAVDNTTVEVILKEVDPTWFVTRNTVDNATIVSLAGKKKRASRSQPAPNPKAESAERSEKEAIPSGPTPSEIAAEKHRAVEERNRAAKAQYEADLAEQKRKVDEFNRLTAEMNRKKAEQQAAAQQALDSHAAQMAKHQQEVSDYQGKLAQQGNEAPGSGGLRQVTSAIVDSREAAMAALMRMPVGPLTNVQCGEVKMFSPPKWTCWGFYRSDTKPAGASAQ